MRPGLSKEWSFITAQTNVAVLTCTSTQRITVDYAKAKISDNASVDVACRIGFATATLPTLTDDSATGADGMILSDAAIRPGSGEISSKETGPFVGALGEDVRITNTAPTGGALRVIIKYNIEDIP